MMNPEQVRELEEYRADFRALMDRADRLANVSVLEAATDEYAEEIADVAFELDAWNLTLAGGVLGDVVVVTGGRDYEDREAVYGALDRAHAARPIRLVVQGGAGGADKLAKDWAISRGVAWETEPAKWDDIERPGAVVRKRRDGKLYDAAAGGIRNGVMLDKYQPTYVAAFPGGTGTADCCKQADQRDIRVWRPRV